MQYLSKPPLGIQPNRLHRLSPDTCYLLNEGAGLRTWDTVQGKQSLDFVNAPVYQGEGMRFAAASTQYIPVADTTGRGVVRTGTQFTIALRIRPASIAASRYFYGEGSSGNATFLRILAQNNSLNIDWRDDASLNSSSLSVSSMFLANVWYTVHVVFNGTIVTAYRNGVQVGAATNALGAMTCDRVTIGAARRSGVDGQFDGDIAWMMGWRRALTPAEVSSHAAQPFQMFPFMQAALRYQYSGANAQLLAELASASALSYAAGGTGGAQFSGDLSTASALALAAALLGGAQFGGEVSAASSLHYAATLLAGSQFGAELSTASAQALSAQLLGGARFEASAVTAVAQAFEAALLGGATFEAALQEATALAFAATLSGGALLPGEVQSATAQALEGALLGDGAIQMNAEVATASALLYAALIESTALFVLLTGGRLGETIVGGRGAETLLGARLRN